jgi:hypothetical protein
MNPAEPLPNARHERFARELAKGCSQDAAFVAAGYRRNDGNAARLNGNERVKARVAWFLAQTAGETVLSLKEKREFLAGVVRLNKDKTQDKLAAIRLDNDLAGEGSEAKGMGALAALLGRVRK